MPALPKTETNQLICIANQLTGFYMTAILALNGLSKKSPDPSQESSDPSQMMEFR